MSIPNRIQLIVVVAVALPTNADACSCYVRPLAERYESASVVFVAKIDKRHDSYDGLGTRTTGWSFETVEVLKGDVSFNKLIRGSCGGRVVEGEEYLIFTGNDGQVDSCTSGQLNRDERYRADLDVLRQRRDGDFETLAEPWVFTKRNGMCSLSLDMTIGSGGLIFDYRFADVGTPEFGNQQFRYDVDEHRTVKLEGVGPHPANFAGFGRLRIWYPHSRYKVAGTGRLTIGGKEWLAQHQNMEAPHSPFELVTHSALSDVLAAVKSNEGLWLSAEYADFPYDLKDYPDFPEIKAATPRYYRGTAVQKFEACVDQAGQ